MGNGLRGFRGSVDSQSYPQDDTRLAYAAALALDVSRYFNGVQAYSDNTIPSLTVSTSGNVNSSNGVLEIEFSASDSSGLATALLRRGGDTIGEMVLQGTSTSSTFVTPLYEPGTSQEYTVSVYDTQGNRANSKTTITVNAGGNRAPEPSIRINHSWSNVGESVTLDASRSSDADHSDGSLLVEWDLDGDGSFDTAPTTNKVLATTFNTPGVHHILARITDPVGDRTVSTPIAVRIVDPFPRVVEIQLNGGLTDPPSINGVQQPTSWQRQQSQLKAIEVTFSKSVDVVTASDVVLVNLGVDAPNDPDSIVSLSEPARVRFTQNQETLRIEFLDPTLVTDGVYQLRLLETIEDLGGQPLDGDGDGVGGGPHEFTGDAQNMFYQLTSEWNGDLGVSVFDFSTFSYWFGHAVGVAPEYVDLNRDQGVSVFDFSGFAANFSTSVSFPTVAPMLANRGEIDRVAISADPDASVGQSRSPVHLEFVWNSLGHLLRRRFDDANPVRASGDIGLVELQDSLLDELATALLSTGFGNRQR